MKFGNLEIKLGANEIVIGTVIVLTFCLLFISPPKDATELFKQGFNTLIAWGAGYATARVATKGEHKE